ncbi:MAG: response regulator transcription factor [Bacteroidetes bacterium]|jgi:two-component system response regulator NreC|nr:response regulator transcription factor [Bacteroidota bacterium]
MTKIRVLLADDHPLVRSGLMALLEPLKEFLIVGEAGDGREAVALTKKLKPDVVVIDLSMPVMSGVEATKIIRQEVPASNVLVLTMHENEEYVFQILRSGAGGYILKNCSREELAAAIRAVAKGEKFFSPKVSEMMVQAYLRKAEARETQAVDPTETPLTPREREVLTCVAEGMTNQEVAEKLFISTRTVETHKTNIMQKLGIEDTAKLIRYAVELKMKGR